MGVLWGVSEVRLSLVVSTGALKSHVDVVPSSFRRTLSESSQVCKKTFGQIKGLIR